MKTGVLVTIAIPTYNRSEAYFREALESVLNQTYESVEIIVADNASTTFDVAAVVASYRDERLRYQRHATNIGLVKNWNWCVREAHGEWVNIFHDDDVMEPANVANAVQAAQRNPEIDFQFSEIIPIGSSGEKISDPYWSLEIPKGAALPGRLLVSHLFVTFANRICAPSVFVRRELYHKMGPFSSFPLFTTDLNMWLKTLNAQRTLFLLREDKGVRYRFHPQQGTANFLKHMQKCLLLEFGRIFLSLSLKQKALYLKKLLAAITRSVHWRLRQMARRQNN